MRTIKYRIFPWKSQKEYKILKDALNVMNHSDTSFDFRDSNQMFMKKLTKKYHDILEKENISHDSFIYDGQYENIEKLKENLKRNRNETFKIWLFAVIFIIIMLSLLK